MNEIYNIPKLIDKEFLLEKSGNINKDLTSRQVITIDLDLDYFINNILSSYERDLYISLHDLNENDLTEDIKNSAFIEYLAESNTFITSIECMKYIKIIEPEKINVIIYGIENSNSELLEIFKDKVIKEFKLPYLDDIEINKKIKYKVFEETKYENIRYNEHSYFILHINVPYEFYSKIGLASSIFSYDIDNNKFYESENEIMIEELLNSYLEDYKENSNILILGNNGNLKHGHSSGDGTDILLAKFLKLPFIPVTIIVTDGVIVLNTVEIKNNRFSIDELNELCKPYFIF